MLLSPALLKGVVIALLIALVSCYQPSFCAPGEVCTPSGEPPVGNSGTCLSTCPPSRSIPHCTYVADEPLEGCSCNQECATSCSSSILEDCPLSNPSVGERCIETSCVSPNQNCVDVAMSVGCVTRIYCGDTFCPPNFCVEGRNGPYCEYSIDLTCNDRGDPTYEGECICYDQNSNGSHCQFTRADTCRNNGKPNLDGSCSCDAGFVGPSCQYSRSYCYSAGQPKEHETYPNLAMCDCDNNKDGEYCQFSDAITCLSRGIVTYSGGCNCDENVDGGNFYGEHCQLHTGDFCNYGATTNPPAPGPCGTCNNKRHGDLCELTDLGDCSNHGVSSFSGTGEPVCECESNWYGPSCEYNSATTCMGNGNPILNANSVWTCDCFTGFKGPRCQFSDLNDCNARGVAGEDGDCTCRSDFPAADGPRCEFSDKIDCNDRGTVDMDGNCDCTGSIDINGPRCEYTRSHTCNGAGTPGSDGSCVCDQYYDGTQCQLNGFELCNGRGKPTNDLGDCLCDDGWYGDHCQASTTACPGPFTWGPNCIQSDLCRPLGTGGISLTPSICENHGAVDLDQDCNAATDGYLSTSYVNTDDNWVNPSFGFSMGKVNPKRIVIHNTFNVEERRHLTNIQIELYYVGPESDIVDAVWQTDAAPQPVAVSPILNPWTVGDGTTPAPTILEWEPPLNSWSAFVRIKKIVDDTAVEPTKLMRISEVQVFTEKCYMGHADCNTRGVLDVDGKCQCHNSVGELCGECTETYAGPSCEFSDELTCRNRGLATYDGFCEQCTEPWGGSYCHVNNDVVCSGHGQAYGEGFECECDPTYAGFVEADQPGCRFSDEQCLGVGYVTDFGECVCDAGYDGEFCEYSDAQNCQDRGTVTYYGFCEECIESDGPNCEYTSENTCSGLADPDYFGDCPCPEGTGGPDCSLTSQVDCNQNGEIQPSGECACNAGYAPTTGCTTCKDNYYPQQEQNDLGLPLCKQCDLAYCGGELSFAGCSEEGVCQCSEGYTGSRCEKQVVDCVQSEWGSWSSCSEECGPDGTRGQQRTITTNPLNGGTACGPSSQSEPCNTEVACSEDCRWSPPVWPAWNSFPDFYCCEEGDTLVYRNRTMIPAVNGGAPCAEQNTFESKACTDEDRCRIDCEYSEWNEWSSCDGLCGDAVSFREKVVAVEPAYGGANCTFDPAEIYDSVPCTGLPVCPTDCEVGEWSDYANCASCGNSTEVRKRPILVPPANGGTSCPVTEESRPCFIKYCPIDCKWTEFEDWSNCTVSCGGGGYRFSRRSKSPDAAFGGAECLGDSIRLQECGSGPCPIDCEYSEWSPFGDCSETCGLGVKERTRAAFTNASPDGLNCTQVYGIEETVFNDFDICQLGECPQDCELSEWSQWTRCTDANTKSRSRTIILEGSNGGISCDSEPLEQRDIFCQYCDTQLVDPVFCPSIDQYCVLAENSCSDCPDSFVQSEKGYQCDLVELCGASISIATTPSCTDPSEVCVKNGKNFYCSECMSETEVATVDQTNCEPCVCDPVFGQCNQTDVEGRGRCEDCLQINKAGPYCNITCPQHCLRCNSGIAGDGLCESPQFCEPGYFSSLCLPCETSTCDAITGEELSGLVSGLDIGSLIGIIAGVVLGVILILLLIGFFVVRKLRKSNTFNFNLPPEILWHVSPVRARKEKWEVMGEDDTFRRMEVVKGTQPYQKVMSLFHEHLRGTRVPIAKIWAISNPALINNFDTQREILRSRIQSDPDLFTTQKWKTGKAEKKKKLREWVHGELERKIAMGEWNEVDELVPIVPVVHGTDAAVGWKIAKNGFTSLSILDAGYYGTGMYFSTSSLYTVPYFGTKKNPVILICFSIPGNSYPVIESRTSPDTLEGSPLRAGYQSHYVCTDPDGNPCRRKKKSGQFHDELVLGQESQILPAYVLEVDPDDLTALVRDFQRDVGPARGDALNAELSTEEDISIDPEDSAPSSSSSVSFSIGTESDHGGDAPPGRVFAPYVPAEDSA